MRQCTGRSDDGSRPNRCKRTLHGAWPLFFGFLPCLHPRLHWASSFLGQDQGSTGMSHEAQKRKAPTSLNGITLKPCGVLSTRKANKKSSAEIRAFARLSAMGTSNNFNPAIVGHPSHALYITLVPLPA